MNFPSARFATAASKKLPWGGVIAPKKSRQKQHTEVRSCSFGACVVEPLAGLALHHAFRGGVLTHL